MKKILAFLSILLLSTVFFGGIIIENSTFEDENIKLVFGIKTEFFTPKYFSIQIINKTDKPIKIIWDETIITDNYGDTSGVIHSGVKFINKDRPQVPSIVPPNGKFEDIIIPKSHISYSSYTMKWETAQIFDSPSERYFLLTYEINGEKHILDGTLLLQKEELNINWGLVLGVLAVLWLLGTIIGQ